MRSERGSSPRLRAGLNVRSKSRSPTRRAQIRRLFRVFTDKASGTLDNRKELAKVLDRLRPGDTLVVWRQLDRLGRSLRHLIETVTALADRKIGFRSLTENIDTTTAGGKLVLHLFGSLAEFERDLIGDRTMAGHTAARARRHVGGRPPALTPDY